MNQRKTNGAWYTPIEDFGIGDRITNNTYADERWGAEGVVWQTTSGNPSLNGDILVKWHSGPDTGETKPISATCKSMMRPFQ